MAAALRSYREHRAKEEERCQQQQSWKSLPAAGEKTAPEASKRSRPDGGGSHRLTASAGSQSLPARKAIINIPFLGDITEGGTTDGADRSAGIKQARDSFKPKTDQHYRVPAEQSDKADIVDSVRAHRRPVSAELLCARSYSHPSDLRPLGQVTGLLPGSRRRPFSSPGRTRLSHSVHVVRDAAGSGRDGSISIDR